MTGYARPASDDDALALRAAHPDWLVLAGGTDLLVAAHHKPAPPGILDVAGRFAGIRADDKSIVIGAGTTYRQIGEARAIRTLVPILAEAAVEVGALQIQQRATIAGNIATSSPVGDGLPVLLALDATLHVASVRGARAVPYHAFCTGYRKIDLAADELITAIEVPVPAAGAYLGWRKVGTRRAQSISKVMAACVIEVQDGRMRTVRFGVGAVADRPIRAREAEAAATGRAPDAETAAAVAAALRASIKPIDDIRSTARYRLDTACNLVARFVENAGRR